MNPYRHTGGPRTIDEQAHGFAADTHVQQKCAAMREPKCLNRLNRGGPSGLPEADAQLRQHVIANAVACSLAWMPAPRHDHTAKRGDAMRFFARRTKSERKSRRKRASFFL
jgi:hypothetical protein